MSQVDKVNMFPVIFWFVILFVLFYAFIMVYFLPLYLQMFSFRAKFLKESLKVISCFSGLSNFMSHLFILFSFSSSLKKWDFVMNFVRAMNLIFSVTLSSLSAPAFFKESFLEEESSHKDDSLWYTSAENFPLFLYVLLNFGYHNNVLAFYSYKAKDFDEWLNNDHYNNIVTSEMNPIGPYDILEKDMFSLSTRCFFSYFYVKPYSYLVSDCDRKEAFDKWRNHYFCSDPDEVFAKRWAASNEALSSQLQEPSVSSPHNWFLSFKEMKSLSGVNHMWFSGWVLGKHTDLEKASFNFLENTRYFSLDFNLPFHHFKDSDISDYFYMSHWETVDQASALFYNYLNGIFFSDQSLAYWSVRGELFLKLMKELNLSSWSLDKLVFNVFYTRIFPFMNR